MAPHLKFLLILTGFIGVHSITTVSKVSVKAGDSITIPCLYSSEYKNHVKYLCKGPAWISCFPAVKTNQPSTSGKFSILDDKNQSIFTVTIRNLTVKETDYYWCIVEINGRTDTGQYFYLAVTQGTPDFYVDHREITGFIGQNITITCTYSGFGPVKWCRLGRNCVTTPFGSIDGTRVAINTMAPSVFTVTMSGLKTESGGWYLCGEGDFEMPVYLTVTEKPATTTLATTTRYSPNQQSASIDLQMLIISLSVLICIVMLTFFIWLMLKKHKKSHEESSPIMMGAEEAVTNSNVKHKTKTSDMAEEEVIYSNVANTRKTSDQRSHAESDVDVMYSSVVIVKKPTVKQQAEDDDVTYSTLAQHQKNI